MDDDDLRDSLREIAIPIAKPQVRHLDSSELQATGDQSIRLDLPATVQWDAADSDPVADIKAMARKMYESYGMMPDRIIVSPQTAKEIDWWLRRHDIFPNMDAWVAPRITRVLRWVERHRRNLRWKYQEWDERRHPEKYF